MKYEYPNYTNDPDLRIRFFMLLAISCVEFRANGIVWFNGIFEKRLYKKKKKIIEQLNWVG